MKNIFKKIFFSVLVTCLFISCSDFSNSDSSFVTNEKGRIIISTDLDSQSRSVLPTGITEQTQGLTWELVGTCEEKTYSNRWNDTISEDGSVTSSAYNNMISDNGLLLDVGTWSFSLKVKNNNGYVLVGKQEATITSGGNILSFVMNEATSDDLSDGETVASGSIEFTLNFPTGVINKGIATLTPLAGGNSFTQDFTANAATSNQFLSSITYENENISAGYYILKIQLQQEGDATTPAVEYINTYSCLIRVTPGLTSYGVYTLDKLAQLYTINYECNQGSIGNPLTTTSYNAYTSFELPEPTLDGHYFAGWYTQDYTDDGILIDEKFFGNAGETITISEDTTLYAKYVKAYEFNLYDSANNEVPDGYKVEKGIGSVTLDNTGNSVWDYYLKSTDIKFTEKNNYKITVEMKAEADTVVAIQAANADMFFTVGTEWTPCTMETGFIEKELDESRNGISFGIGLSKITSFRNLVIEPISSDDDGLPTLVFDITTEGINQYLSTTNKADKIIEVEKTTDTDNKLVYNITINAPLTNGNSVQNVKLHLRDYAKSVGVNNVSFKVLNTGSNPFATSFMADTASNNSMAWNNVRTEVVSANSCNIDFPNYIENDELTVDVITGSSVTYQNYPVKFTISEFKVEEPVATAGPFSGKIFAIQVGETWTQEKSVEVTIPANNNIEFDVGMFNVWDSSQNKPSSFDDVTRFLYTGDTKITDNLSYSSDPNAPTYTITNNSSSDVKVKITLDADYKVQIEEVENQPIDLTVDSLQNYLEPNNNLYRLPTGEYRVTGNLTLFYPIYIDDNSTVKIYADDNVEIIPALQTLDPMINLPMSTNSTLTLGGGNGTLTLKGTGVSSGSVISSNTSLIIEDGFKLIECDVCAINVTSGTFTMNGGEITNISREGHIINIAGGTAIFNGGSIYNNECVDLYGTSYCIYVDTGTLNIPSNSTASIYNNYSSVSAGDYDTEKGAFIYNNNGTVTILDSALAKGTCYDKAINSGSSGIETNANVSQFSELKEQIESVSDTAYTLENPYVIGITSSFDIGTDITTTTNVKSHIKLVAINPDGCTITKNDSLAAVNIFTVEAGASLTLGDSNAVGELIIDGNETLTTTTKSLISVTGTLVLNEKSTLQNNKCKEGFATNGAAVYSNNGTVKILGGTVKNNSNSYNDNTGGAIYIKNGTFEMTAGVVSNNSSYSSGGAIYAESSTVTISGGTFDTNKASSIDNNKVYGGALFLSKCTVNITGGTFSNNIATNTGTTTTNTEFYGGAIYIINSGTSDAPALISNCTFSSNSAYQNGGAIYTGGTSYINIDSSNFKNNTVTNGDAQGSAVYIGNMDGNIIINNCEFSNTPSDTIFTVYNGSQGGTHQVNGSELSSKSGYNPN